MHKFLKMTLKFDKSYTDFLNKNYRGDLQSVAQQTFISMCLLSDLMFTLIKGFEEDNVEIPENWRTRLEICSKFKDLLIEETNKIENAANI